MAGRGEPPEGSPGGGDRDGGEPGGGEPGGRDPGADEDEYRSFVFDESFIRAARLEEFSAVERMDDHAHAVRTRPVGRVSAAVPRRGCFQALVLALLVTLAFGTAVYVGVRPQYGPAITRSAEPLRMNVIPLVPTGAVPGGEPGVLLAHSPAAQFRTGAAGITLPPARRTAHFSEGEVMTALTTVKDYLVASSLDPDVLAGNERRSVRVLLDPGQLGQFDRSFSDPADDGRHDPAGWLVRFDAAKVAPADTAVRVRGTLRVEDTGAGTLDVIADHTLVYALRPAAVEGEAGERAEQARASLFTVRRALHFRFDREDLPRRRLELLTSQVLAGPQSCSARAAGTLRPLLAGQRATATDPAPTDPYTKTPRTADLCGTLPAPELPPRA